jgi:ankyrin repeat protein
LIEKLFERPDAAGSVALQNNPSKLAPIHVAAKYGATWMLSDLKKLGCNVLAKTEQGTFAIHIAAAEGFNDFIDQLLDSGVQVDDKDNIGYTALFYAVMFNKLETVKFLLEKGAKTGTQCQFGSTPLLNAVLKGDLEITQVLYRFKDGHKFKAPYKLVHAASGLQSSELVKWLCEQGEDIRDLDGSVIGI